MKLIDTILLSVAFALLMIGVHQVIMNSWQENYWIIMLAIILFGVYSLRKTNKKTTDND